MLGEWNPETIFIQYIIFVQCATYQSIVYCLKHIELHLGHMFLYETKYIVIYYKMRPPWYLR